MIFHPKRMLVTGGAGFIGSNFVRYMLKTDERVRIVNLDKLTYAGATDNLKGLPDESRHTFVNGDICDAALVDRLLRKYEIDTIVHFAAESHVDNSITGPAIFLQTNVTGTFTLLEAARRYWLQDSVLSPQSSVLSPFRFHHISTDEVYGALGKNDPPFIETTPYAPNSPYSASKAASDHLVRAWRHTYGLPVTTSNCSNNYGPRQHAEKFIPTVIRCCRQGRPIPVYGDGGNIRDWLYVEDHCAGIDAVIRRGRLGETYNIGSGNEWENIDIASMICRLMDNLHPSPLTPHTKLITFVKDRPGHDWRYAINAGKMAHELDWHPGVSFETGMARTIEWYFDSLTMKHAKGMND